LSVGIIAEPLDAGANGFEARIQNRW